MKIEDFLADRAWSNYGAIYNDPEYKRHSDRLLELYKAIVAKLDLEGETIVSEIKSLHSAMVGITNMFTYKRGFRDGLKLGWLLAEIKDSFELDD